MRIDTNKFGSDVMYEAKDLQQPIYLYGAACMSIQTEALSFANGFSSLIFNHDAITKDPALAKSIVVLCCQVTDLAIHNDLKHVYALRNKYPVAQVYVGGCLAKRFDISLPNGVRRVEPLRKDYQPIEDKTLVGYAPPFWVNGFKEGEDALADGHLFRDSYPLRIGVGCKKKCTYCTIRITRGEFYGLDMKRLIVEFVNHDDVVLICESPTADQIKDWCDVARVCNKPISVRNLEPQVYSQCCESLFALANLGLLKVLHIPVQSTNPATLQDMARDVRSTLMVLDDMPKFQKAGTITATNTIIDYKDFPNPTDESLSMFNYVSWNPYWDGKWDPIKAEERFNKYLGA